MSHLHAVSGRRAKRVAEATVAELGGELDDLLSTTRKHPEDAFRRAVAMYVYHELWGKDNLSETGRAFGRDRSTVRHALDRVLARIAGTGEADAVLRSSIRTIREAVA